MSVKRLIEVDLPIKRISAHARRENDLLYAWARSRGAADDHQARRHWPSLFGGHVM